MTLVNSKAPTSVDWASIVVPRVSLMSDTVAPGMRAPCESLTFPTTEPVVCAPTGVRARTMRMAMKIPEYSRRLSQFMASPLHWSKWLLPHAELYFSHDARLGTESRDGFEAHGIHA